MPLGSLPVMEVNDTRVTQTSAQARFAGKLAGLYPEDPFEALLVDQVLDTFDDVFSAMIRYKGSDDEGLRADREKFVKEDVPRYVGGCQNMIDDLKRGGPYVLGEKMSIADLCITMIVNLMSMGMFSYVPTDLCSGYPTLLRSHSAVMSIPEVQAHYKKFPIPKF